MYAAGLVVSAVIGGGLALGGAALLGGIGTSTNTVREVVPIAAEPILAASSSGKGLTVNQIYRRSAPGVVQVTATQIVSTPSVDPFGSPFPRPQQAKALGSGFVIDKAGHVVTNYHVVANSRPSRSARTRERKAGRRLTRPRTTPFSWSTPTARLDAARAGNPTSFTSATRWWRSATPLGSSAP
jgi:S1-C subfamily serine protease